MKANISCIIVAAALAGLSSPAFPNAGQAKNVLTIKDSLDRTVAIPSRVERIITIQPEISRLIVALGAGDTLVGVDYTLRLRDPLFMIVYPEGSRLPLVSMAENNINLEMVLRLKPDLVFVSPYERQIVSALQRKTQIPVVALSSMGSFSKLVEEARLVGRILGRERRADELAAYFDETLRRLGASLKNVPQNKKPRVYLSFGGSLTRTPIFYEPVNAAGGTNVAEKLLPDFLGVITTAVNIEQIVRWDPDIILVHGNYPPPERKVTPVGVLADSRLASVKAVKAKKVYYTFGFWDWWDMAEVLTETLYLANMFYPDAFPGFDLKREGDAIIKKFYGVEGGFSALSKILRCDEWTHEQ